LFCIQSYYPTSIDFILRQSCFPQIHSFSFGSSYGFKVSTPDLKFLLRFHSLLLWILSYYSRSKVSTPDPKFHTVDPQLLLQIQSFLLWIQRFFSGSNVSISDPTLLFKIQSFLLWIQSYYSRYKVVTLDPKFLTLDPKLFLQI